MATGSHFIVITMFALYIHMYIFLMKDVHIFMLLLFVFLLGLMVRLLIVRFLIFFDHCLLCSILGVKWLFLDR